MIDNLDILLRDLIQSRVPALAGSTQVGFEAPDEEWRLSVLGASEDRVNLYLYDLRENMKLRSNARTREAQDGWYIERPAPPRLDCHYLVTAWSWATFSPPAVEPSPLEHALLYDVLEVLMRHRPLSALEVFKFGEIIPSGNMLQSVPLPLQAELPLEVVQVEGPRNLGDFWNTMKLAWKPALHLTVTIPVVLLQPDFESPAVTTMIGDYRQAQDVATAEVLLTIGGRVLAGAEADAVRGAWVQIVGLQPADLQIVNRRLITGPDGRFQFSRLRQGRYRIRAVAAGIGDLLRDVDVPSETGEYDVRFA
jgi:Pvc16 N-terminal domain